jgi:hypothetical protein
MPEIFWGDSLIRTLAEDSSGRLVQRDGEMYYRISNYQAMAPFLMAIVSGADHWMFVSSTGGLTCGRRNPGLALFPYYTDDKIHDAWSTTGPQTSVLVSRDSQIRLWKPFWPQADVYGVERNLYKNLAGTRLIFEEINRQLGLSFSYSWSSSDRFGFVRKCSMINTGSGDVGIEVLDGLRNLLPCGIDASLQATMSTLMDAYKQAEALPDCPAALYTMSSIPTDRAEPSEALNATVAWCLGLRDPAVLLSEDQCGLFESGTPPGPEKTSKGKRGAFFVHESFDLAAGEGNDWYLLSDVNQGPSQLAALLKQLREGVTAGAVEADIEAGLSRLRQRVGSADGFQQTSDTLVTGRHFSNTLFNIMRGGVFYDAYRFSRDDFTRFANQWNSRFSGSLGTIFAKDVQNLSRDQVIAAAENSGDADLERIALEYLPLTFSRRHGDPSRPWNRFSIDIRNADGSEKLYYQGNWRDIFQNWEALALSYPEYLESFIAKFVNASTADGYNPYRITRDGFDWEKLEPNDPWSNIGYWGDHQVNYLLKLLEMSHRYHPGRISAYLEKRVFVYADIPYRIKGYQSLLQDPRNSVDYDLSRAEQIAGRVDQLGSDGQLVTAADGSICRVTLIEKLLVPALVKLGNFVPGGGIWMNTQRPEWNDANNALAGFGLSMVTLCYLRRYLSFLSSIVEQGDWDGFTVSSEVVEYLEGIHEVLRGNTRVLGAGFTPGDRKSMMDELGKISESYRQSVYGGLSGATSVIDPSELLAFMDLTGAYLDQSITQNRRVDGLFHSYNLVGFGDEGYTVEHLPEMLEGQVAVLSSGYLGAIESLDLLNALESSRIYRSDQNSFMLYPYRKLPPFSEKNFIEDMVVQGSEWMKSQIETGVRDFIEEDVNGHVHFNGRFRNAGELRIALGQERGIAPGEIDALCGVFEDLFEHRQFTGRSGAMYKYEGLGCIYWHMVSKLLLATSETIGAACRGRIDRDVLSALLDHFDRIQAGLGVHKSPAQYGAIPLDPYSHTTGFSGVQQPGMTGQVKEDMITRFAELGVDVEAGEVIFSPLMLRKSEFISEPVTWNYTTGNSEQRLELASGTLAFTLCGVPVIYRLAESAAIEVDAGDEGVFSISGNRLGADWSAALFRRENRISQLLVDLPQTELRD